MTLEEFRKLDALAKSFIPESKTGLQKIMELRVPATDEEIIKVVTFIALQGHGLKHIISPRFFLV